MTTEDRPTPTLAALAEAYGVATGYWSFFGERVEVPATTLRLILRAMGVEAEDEASAATALVAAEEAPWRSLVPPSVVARQTGGEFFVHVADGCDVEVVATLEDGSRRTLPIPGQQPDSRTIDGSTVWRVRVPLPDDLPVGWHTVTAGEHRGGIPSRAGKASLVVTPDRLAPPRTRPGSDRAWGLMAQLYSVRSRQSWGVGDFADLADLATVAAQRGADFLLVNPIHAAEVTAPIEPSPYLPATRRFIAPLYIRPEDIREAAYLGTADREAVAAARTPAAATDTDPELVDRDLAWTAKRAALEIIHAVLRTPARQRALDAFVTAGGSALQDFGLWCALEEHYAELPVGRERPAEARDIRSPLVAELRARLAHRVAFHVWLQWVADEQAQQAQRAARAAGMSVGIMHDLAVGVDPEGSDAWSLREMYAQGMRVGAPPDMYNQQGQDWSQPPWLPPALAATGYAPLRDMIRNLLRHAGALRIDHVIGLFRLWWIPEGHAPTAGTYVRYDHEAMIGVLALEAERAGAVLIGEDLGNVEPWVRDYLSSRGVLGTSVLWFEYEGDGFKPPEHYREAVLATVNTHDLPPTAGYLAGEHVDLRAKLGLLTEPVEQVRAEAMAERDGMLSLLRDRGLIDADATEQEIVEALHVLLTASPSLLLGVGLVDTVGERRVQNQPGTHREYPNWQVPLAGPDGRCVLIEDLATNERFASLTAAVNRALGRSTA